MFNTDNFLSIYHYVEKKMIEITLD